MGVEVCGSLVLHGRGSPFFGRRSLSSSPHAAQWGGGPSPPLPMQHHVPTTMSGVLYPPLLSASRGFRLHPKDLVTEDVGP